ncbi:MAG: hypothetical protein HQM12_13415 [SAR324 cluster bacterium]|nr:hypothetical protein [SAR324 cluster bacterium]
MIFHKQRTDDLVQESSPVWNSSRESAYFEKLVMAQEKQIALLERENARLEEENRQLALGLGQ